MHIGKLTASTQGRKVPFELRSGEALLVGRGNQCAVRLSDPAVSRQHCRLELVDGKLRVTDLESSQGIAYRGRRVGELLIEVGDGFHVGQTFILFDACSVAPLEESAPSFEPPPALPPESRPAPPQPQPRAIANGAAARAGDRGDLPAGTAFGAFVVGSVLGRSDRCTVYRARQPALDRDAVLKVASQLPGSVGAPAATELLADARAAAAPVDQRVVPVFDVGHHGDAAWVAMAPVPGRSLAEHLAGRAPMAWPAVIAVLDDVLLALDAMHAQGLIHGAVKPSNVFVLDRGGALLADRRASPRPRPGEAPNWFAPEQKEGQPVDARADLFGIGAVAYAALFGEPPPADARDTRALTRQMTDRLLSAGTEVPPQLLQLVLELLAAEPKARPATAALVRDQLRKITAPATSPTAPPGVPAPVIVRSERGEDVPIPRRRPPSAAKTFAARLLAEFIVFTVILAVGIVLLILLKVKWPGIDIYRLVGK
jgi:hypothetical protein